MNPPSFAEEIFRRLLDESAALLASPENAGIAIPNDELHREILVPLLPAMIGDGPIRKHWAEQIATGFPARLARHLDRGESAPRWLADDFEIHVTASYSAGPDARALADTLLSEESLRDLAAALMNQVLDALWPSLGVAPAVVPEVAAPVEAAVEEARLPESVVAFARPLTFEVPGKIPGTAGWKPALPGARQFVGLFLGDARRRKAALAGRRNPISGSRVSRGKLGAPDWNASYPIAGGISEP